MFDAAVHSGRRKALLGLLAARGIDEGLAVFIGNRQSPKNYADNCHDFRQDSSFLYFIGPNDPDLAAAIDLGTGKTTLYGEDAGPDDIVWTGPRPGIADIASRAGIDRTARRAELARDVACASVFYFLPPYRQEGAAEIDGLVHLTSLSLLSPEELHARAILPLVRAAVALREIKSEAEILEMEHAVDISVRMHEAAMRSARPGMRECEVAAEIVRVALAAGGQTAFPVIATTRGQTLHNLDRNNVLRDGGLFLVDAGAETESGYAGDLSSTFPIGSRFDARQREIYEISLAAQRAASSLVGPGVAFRDVHFAACRSIVEGLKSIGLMHGLTEDILASGAHALFFPCGTGHQIGLDVHDMESYGEIFVGYDGEAKSPQFGLKSLRMAKTLKPGMVVTVEPGIYFIPELAERWKKDKTLSSFVDFTKFALYAPIGGIRNEENWLVTSVGGRALGPAFDKSAEAVESRRPG